MKKTPLFDTTIERHRKLWEFLSEYHDTQKGNACLRLFGYVPTNYCPCCAYLQRVVGISRNNYDYFLTDDCVKYCPIDWPGGVCQLDIGYQYSTTFDASAVEENWCKEYFLIVPYEGWVANKGPEARSYYAKIIADLPVRKKQWFDI